MFLKHFITLLWGCLGAFWSWWAGRKHQNMQILSFRQKKRKEGTFVGSFCFPLTLILMQTGSFCQDKYDVLALLLSVVLAEGQGVSRMFEGRKVPIMRQLGRSYTLNTWVRNSFHNETFLYTPINQKYPR